MDGLTETVSADPGDFPPMLRFFTPWEILSLYRENKLTAEENKWLELVFKDMRVKQIWNGQAFNA